jgi:thiamine biosynthesis lipoprotein
MRKLHSQVEIDLSAIAKGYAVDKVGELLESKGVKNYILEIGGEVRARGKAPEHSWRAGVDVNIPGLDNVEVFELTDLSVATSGTYQNQKQENGKRLSHIISPKTGFPVTHTTEAVSVFHSSCAMADAWATALLVLGSVDGTKLAEAQNIKFKFFE